MANYKIANSAKEDLVRIHQYEVLRFGEFQADKYFNNFFDFFKAIAENPYKFESVDHIRLNYRSCPCGSDTIYFRVINSQVEIMAIIGKQDLENIL